MVGRMGFAGGMVEFFRIQNLKGTCSQVTLLENVRKEFLTVNISGFGGADSTPSPHARRIMRANFSYFLPLLLPFFGSAGAGVAGDVVIDAETAEMLVLAQVPQFGKLDHCC